MWLPTVHVLLACVPLACVPNAYVPPAHVPPAHVPTAHVPPAHVPHVFVPLARVRPLSNAKIIENLGNFLKYSDSLIEHQCGSIFHIDLSIVVGIDPSSIIYFDSLE